MATRTLTNDMLEDAPGVDLMPPIEGQVELGNASLDELADAPQPIDTPFLNYGQGFYDNLAEQIPEDELGTLGEELKVLVQADEEDRHSWFEIYEKALKSMDQYGGAKSNQESETRQRLAKVKQTLLPTAVQHFNARAITEVLPPTGPVKVNIVGQETDELEAQAERVQEFLNYEIMNRIEGYYETMDQMLFHLALTGQTFKKICWHPIKGKADVEFVEAEHLIVSPNTKDLASSPRFAHRMQLTANEFQQLVETGYYLDAPLTDRGVVDDDLSVAKMVEGTTSTSAVNTDPDVCLLDVYTYHRFESVDAEDGSEVMIPYIITIEESTAKVVGVRRNWAEDDILRQPLQHFVSYKFLPGTSFYGFGLYHFIGGLDKTATDSMRALLDSAAYSNSVTGFKRKGTAGGTSTLAPGEMKEIQGGADKIDTQIMPIKFPEPSATLMALLEYVEQQGQRFASTTDLNVGDLTATNQPVGTTMALIEQGAKPMTAIHRRIHEAQKQEFQILVRLYASNLPDQATFAPSGVASVITAQDFDGRIDIVPCSDPNISSNTQRIMQAQAIHEIAVAHPDIVNLPEAVENYITAMGADKERFLIVNQPPPLMDPATENSVVMRGGAIQVYPMQDHISHIAVHIDFMQNPSLGASPFGEMSLELLMSHIRDHIAEYYKMKVFSSFNIPPGEQLDPDTERVVSQQIAQLVSQYEIEAIPAIREMQADPTMDLTIQIAQLDMQIERDKADMELIARREKLKAELDAIKTKAEANADISVAQNQLKLDQMKEQFNQTMKEREAELRQELLHEQERHIADLKNEYEEEKAGLQREAQKLKADLEIAKKKADATVPAPKKEPAGK